MTPVGIDLGAWEGLTVAVHYPHRKGRAHVSPLSHHSQNRMLSYGFRSVPSAPGARKLDRHARAFAVVNEDLSIGCFVNPPPKDTSTEAFNTLVQPVVDPLILSSPRCKCYEHIGCADPKFPNDYFGWYCY